LVQSVVRQFVLDRQDGGLAWRQHNGGHTVVPNWPTFLQFAGRNIKTPALVQ
jgi:hypothetical protein